MVDARVRSVVWVACFAVAAASGSAAAQTYGDFTPILTPALGGVVQQDGSLSDGVEITSESFFSNPNDPNDPSNSRDVALGCIPANQNVRLLRFSLYTNNDGYLDIFFDKNSQGGAYTLQDNLWVLTGFAPFVLIDTTTKANATRAVGGQQVAAAGLKTYFSLEADKLIPFYRTDAASSSPIGSYVAPEFVSKGWYDDYDIGTENLCQYIRIDGLVDGTYDLLVEENAPRLLASPIDGRLYDNVTSMRIRITGNAVKACLGNPQDPNDCPGPTVIDSATRTIGPSVVAGPPAVVTRNTNTYDLFYVGTDGGLYTINQGTTGVWPSGSNGTLIFNSTAAGYPLAGQLAAIARDRVPMDVFGATTAHDLVRLSWDGSVWHFAQYGVEATGSGAASTPAAVAASPTSAMVAWMSLNGSVQVGRFAGGAWQAPTPMGGIFFPSNQTPALAASGDGMFHLFVRDGAGQVWYNRNTNGAWAGWRNLGGNVIGNLTAASSYLNRVDIFCDDAGPPPLEKHLVRNHKQLVRRQRRRHVLGMD